MGTRAEVPPPVSMLGDPALWVLPKTAFLCSRKVSAAQVLKCYDWAIAMREAGRCVMLGAHSPLEKDVLHYLLKGSQPVVLVLARGMKKRLEPPLKAEVSKGRLLVVSPFLPTLTRISSLTALARNRFMLQHAQQVVVGMVSATGSVAHVLSLSGRPYQQL